MARSKSPVKLDAKLQVYLAKSLKELLVRRARDEHLSESGLTVKALTLYLTKDIEDESLLIAKMTELQRQVEYIEKKIDISQKKDIQWEQFLLAFQPELPLDNAVREMQIKRASQRYLQFLTHFRDRSRALPSMLETVMADMREENASSPKAAL
jgi:hypothetical protein